LPIVCIVLLTLAALGSLHAQQSALEQARTFVASRTSFDQAKLLLEKIIASDARNAEAHFLLGEILYAYADYERASAEAEKAVSLNGNQADYHLLLGNSLSGRLDSAGMFQKVSLARRIKTEFEQAIAEDPKNLQARASLVEFYVSAPSIVGGSSSKAMEEARQISALDPIEGHNAMALFYLDQKKLSDAEQEYKAAINADQKRAKSYVRLAYVYILEKKDAEAAPLFKRALELDPDYLPACLGVARTDLLSGQNLDEAEHLLKRYLSRWPEEGDPSLANAHWRLGQVYEKQGKKELAVAEWNEALRLTPNYKPALDSLKAAGK
jgi:tetratricopeptide (TPR) repeat protein